jgi:hypothetical protein
MCGRLEVRRRTDFSYIPHRVRVTIEQHSQLLGMIERQTPPQQMHFSRHFTHLHSGEPAKDREALFILVFKVGQLT